MILENVPSFIRFSTSHLLVMLFSLLLFIFLPYLINKNQQSKKNVLILKLLGYILIGNEIGWVIFKFSLGHNYWAEYMPFELCTINAYLLGFILILNPSYAIFEVVYFWAMAGTLQGIITPRLFAGYPHYLFFEYFITHSGIIIATLVLIFYYNWRVTWLSLFRSFVWLQIPAIINLIFDFTFDVNYMFMRELPKVPSLLDHFGDWPRYILISEIFALLSFMIFLSPFLFYKLIKHRN